MSSRENAVVAVVVLVAAPLLLWPLRGVWQQVLQTWLIAGALAFAGAGLVVGAIVAWNRLLGLFRRSD
jgi:hypothetical protein